MRLITIIFIIALTSVTYGCVDISAKLAESCPNLKYKSPNGDPNDVVLLLLEAGITLIEASDDSAECKAARVDLACVGFAGKCSPENEDNAMSVCTTECEKVNSACNEDTDCSDFVTPQRTLFIGNATNCSESGDRTIIMLIGIAVVLSIFAVVVLSVCKK